MLLLAFRVNLLADHETASLIVIFPPLPDDPLELRIVTFALPRFDVSRLPVISPPLAATVKSTGSINQSPVTPEFAETLIATSLTLK